jgi:hypothetical protein
MRSPAEARRRHQRLFAWISMLATISLSCLVGIEMVFPTPPLSLPPERSLLDLLDFDLPDPKLLTVVMMLVVDLASFAGLIITTLLDWVEGRHRHRHRHHHRQRHRSA